MAGRELRLIPPDGEPLVITDRGAGYRTLKGISGLLGIADAQHVTETTPLLDGEQITASYEMGRTGLLPLLVLADDHAGLRARLRALAAALRPGADTLLECAQADGQRRRLAVRYVAGLDGAESRETGGDTTWHKVAVRVYAPDPAWFDPEPVRLVFTAPAPTPFFPILPVRPSADSVLGEAVITNPGDLIAYPVWSATAPGSALEIDNEDTGAQLHLTGTITDDVRIDVRPGQQDIRMGTADWWSNLDGDPQLWPLPPGDTNASLSLTGAGPGSSIAVEFRPRYRSAW